MKLRLPAAPLFFPALGFLVATLVVAEIAIVVVMLNLPPPTPEVYSVGDVVLAMRADGPVQTPDGRDLSSRLEPSAPASSTQGHRRLRFRAMVAKMLRVSPVNAVVAQPGPRIVAFGMSPGPPSTRQWAQSEAPFLLGAFELGVRQPNGQWRVVSPTTGLGVDPWQARLLLVLAITAVAVSPLAW